MRASRVCDGSQYGRSYGAGQRLNAGGDVGGGVGAGGSGVGFPLQWYSNTSIASEPPQISDVVALLLLLLLPGKLHAIVQPLDGP